MKTKLRLSILSMLIAFAHVSISAADFEVDDFEYDVISFDEMTCAIVGYNTNEPVNLVIPETVVYNGRTFTVTRIDYRAFDKCFLLISVTIPNSVIRIGQYAFSRCTSLKSINIPNSVIEISEYAFSGCTSLASITIPNSVTIIGDHAFDGCSSLTSVTIPGSITSISEYAFRDCLALKSISIQNGVASIESYAFCDCDALTSVTIPNSVTSIKPNAFCDCDALDIVTIPKSVVMYKHSFYGTYPKYVIVGSTAAFNVLRSTYTVEITLLDDFDEDNNNILDYDGDSGSSESLYFQNCWSLERIISLTPTPPTMWYSYPFSNQQIMNLEVLVPTSALPLYQQAEGWKDLWNLKGGAETATGIENVTVPSKGKKSCIYNINGMKVEHTVPGEIYIKDGKKFIAR